MFRDLSMFMDSLKNARFLSDASPEEWQTFFDSVIAVSYRSGLYQASQQLQEKFGVQLPAIAERVIALQKNY